MPISHRARTTLARSLRVASLIFAFALLVPAFASAKTIVSLQFDDGTTDQLQAATLLHAHGFHGTYFIISGRIGQSGYMTLQDIQGLQAAGDEIGGHTITHPDLPTLTTAQATTEICGGRTALINDGFPVTDFAYPFGDYNATDEQIAQSCGYDSAREIGDLVTPTSCSGCDYAETIPPQDRYAVRTPGSIQSSETLPQIEASVTNADSHGGGWLPLVMHHVCKLSDPNCDPQYSIDPDTLSAFLVWLQARVSAGTDVVETAHQVIGGTVPDTTPPSSTASSPATSTSTGWSVSYTAADNTGGSGLAKVDLYAKAPGASTYSKVLSNTSGSASGTFAYTAAAGNGAYSFYTIATDIAGNVEAAPSTADATTTLTVSTVTPLSAVSIATSNLVGGTKGKFEKGDGITFTYSEPVKPSTVLAGWTGAALAVHINVDGSSSTNSVLTVWTMKGTAQLPLGSVNLGGIYNQSAEFQFNATMVENGSAITFTLGAKHSGQQMTTAVKGGTVTWTPSAAVTDADGNKASTTPVSTPGPAF